MMLYLKEGCGHIGLERHLRHLSVLTIVRIFPKFPLCIRVCCVFHYSSSEINNKVQYNYLGKDLPLRIIHMLTVTNH